MNNLGQMLSTIGELVETRLLDFRDKNFIIKSMHSVITRPGALDHLSEDDRERIYQLYTTHYPEKRNLK